MTRVCKKRIKREILLPLFSHSDRRISRLLFSFSTFSFPYFRKGFSFPICSKDSPSLFSKRILLPLLSQIRFSFPYLLKGFSFAYKFSVPYSLKRFSFLYFLKEMPVVPLPRATQRTCTCSHAPRRSHTTTHSHVQHDEFTCVTHPKNIYVTIAIVAHPIKISDYICTSPSNHYMYTSPSHPIYTHVPATIATHAITTYVTVI